MIRLIIGILAIIILASVIGIDCLTCGQGKHVRDTLKRLFQKGK